MKERPILFSGPMVRAIIEGRKTQTRRPVKPQPNKQFKADPYWHIGGFRWTYNGQLGAVANPIHCPFGEPGDRLWVRETFALEPKSGAGDKVLYRADKEQKSWAWRPSIHMPQWASRITLEVTDVRVERLLNLTAQNAIAEGMPIDDPIYDFSNSWNLIYAKKNLGWGANPWVWVIEFRKVNL